MTEEKIPKLHKAMLLFYCVCGLLLLMAFGLMIFRMVLNNELKDKLNKIRAAGYPATLEELNDYYPAVPDDENAALLYEKAFPLFHDIDDNIFIKKNDSKKYSEQILNEMHNEEIQNEQSNRFKKLVLFYKGMPIPVLGERLSHESNIANRYFISVNNRCISKLQQVAKLPQYRFPIDLNEGSGLLLPHLNSIRDVVRMLSIATILAAEDGNAQQATKHILTMLMICHTLDKEPLLISYFVKIYSQRIIVDTIEYTLSLIKLDDASLNQIGEALETSISTFNSSFLCAFAGEQAMVFDFKFLKSSKIKSKYQVDKFTGILMLNQLKILEIYSMIFLLNYNDFNSVKQYVKFYNKQKTAMNDNYFWAKKFTRSIPPILYKKFIIETKIKAAIISIAIERYQLKYHKLPDKLTKLVPEFIKKLPNDPFTDKPFHYVTGKIEIPVNQGDKRLYPKMGSHSKKYTYENGDTLNCLNRSGYMIYSYDQDGVDNSGVPIGISDSGLFGGSNDQQSDISFRCIRKPATRDNN